jgi:hypothetical protein
MEEKILLAVYSGLVALAGGLIGFLVNHYLAIRREINLRRRVETTHYLEQQIGELYGPLLGLIEHSEMVYAILRKKLAHQAVPRIDFTKLNEQDGQVWRFFQERFFLPINSDIRDLIRSKTHLLERGQMPVSFSQFFVHEAHYSCLHPLWKELGISSLEVRGVSWPDEFAPDVKSTLRLLTQRHQRLIEATHLD